MNDEGPQMADELPANVTLVKAAGGRRRGEMTFVEAEVFA